MVLAALGATLGSALDAIHTHFGATAYSRPVIWAMAWWVPPLFAGAFSVGLVRPLLGRTTGRRLGPPRTATVLLAFVLFVAAYWVSVLPLAWPVVSALLLAIFAASWWCCDRSGLGLLVAVGAAIGGPLFESAFVALGTFVHIRPAYLGVSGWLPFLYLSAAIALQCAARWLVEA